MKTYKAVVFTTLTALAVFALAACSSPTGGQDPTYYTVTFDKNGGDSEANPSAKTVLSGGTVDEMPAPPERTGFIFIGWSTADDAFTTATAVTGDLVVYAAWLAEPASSTITLYKGTSVIDPAKKVESVTDLASAAAWLFTPGNLSSDTEYLAVLGDNLELSTGFAIGGMPLFYNNITVTVQGDASVRTIKLNAKSNLQVLGGVTMRLGNNIRLRGHNQGDDGENNEYPLVFINGGTVEMLSGSEISGNTNERSGGDAYGGGVHLRSGAFTMKGGVVKDNVLTVDGGKTGWGAGVFVEGGAFSMEGGAKIEGDVCLWGDTTISVTNTLSETTAAVIQPYAYVEGRAVLSGAAFAANYGAFSVKPKGTDIWTITGEGKLAAPRWNITWNLDSGSWTGTPPATQVITGGKITQPAAPAKGGFAFGGWYKEVGLTTPWDFAADTVTADTALYARWIINPVVTFNANGGTPVPAAQAIAVGGLATEPAAPAKAVYTFGGWYKEAGLTTAWDFATDTVTTDTMLYAKWITNPTVTFNTNGGSSVPTQNVAYGGMITEPVSPTKTGHSFDGWYRDAGLTTRWNFAADTVTANIALYAGWVVFTFTTPAQYRTMVPLNGATIVGNAAYQAYDSSGVFIVGRTVILSPFSIARHETTYALWYEVREWALNNGYTFANLGMEGYGSGPFAWESTGTPPTEARKYCPVLDISWRDAIVWCNAYSEASGKEPVYYTDITYTTVLKISTDDSAFNTAADLAVMKPGANGYRLPTEAEWEYAARGGGVPSTTGPFVYAYAGSDSIGDVAWWANNANYGSHTVGTKAANSAGLYDMSGNAYEWCWDWGAAYSTGTETNPTGPATGKARVVRGGAYSHDYYYCRVTDRNSIHPAAGRLSEYYGFRVVCRP
ncbi:MAG: InlB B-repeat-containing protein [Treponema sp.]|jgi:uncharacterized repeat protein (TIGR02543 family)|nr:InlB B-repeat-containing protein [Treponema sp.]